MKKLVALALATSIALAGCEPSYRTLPTGPNGEMEKYRTYGLLNADTAKSDKVCYELSIMKLVLSIALIETVLVPFYFIGWDIFDPVSIKGPNGCKIDDVPSK